MSRLINFTGGQEDILYPPTGLAKKINSTNPYYGFHFPTPDNDGSYVSLPPGGSAGNYGISKYNSTRTLQWSILGTDVDANADFWTGVFWLDTSDSAIWVWVYGTGIYRLAKIALSDGAITSVGTCIVGGTYFQNAFNHYYFERASMGSGNLTIRDGDYKIVLDTSDGSIVSGPTQVTQNGVAINDTVGYETNDGSIYGGVFYSTKFMLLQRGGLYLRVDLPNTPRPYSSSYTAYPILWSDYIAISGGDTNGLFNTRFFNRIDFDNWLKNIADYYGFPE